MKKMSSNWPKISIVTPSFNQGRFIKRTIDSVLSQKYENLEYLVVDGASTDETIDILKSYGNKIKWISEKDKGQTDAINKGMKKMCGEIVAYLNSDGYYLPGTLRKVADEFQKDKELSWLTGDYIIVDAEEKQIQSFVTWYKDIWKLFPGKISLQLTNYVCQPATFWKSELFEKIGYFDEGLRYTMDYDFWMRLVGNYKLKIVGDKFCAFRIHKTSKGGVMYGKQFDEEMVVVRRYNNDKIIDLIHEAHNAIIKLIYSFIK